MPTPLADYEVLEALGAGGCGMVFKARQLKLDRIVAIKTLSAVTPQGAARFEREARVLAKLHHPNVVQIFDLGRYPDGRLFFAMELLPGEDLAQHIRKQGPLDERTALAVTRQVAAGLAHAHSHGIIHRDVKPANLFLVPPPLGFALPEGVPMAKVTDFGLALLRADNILDDRLTSSGVILGTPVYMPPEQFQASTTDHRGDIYSLGATLFFTLDGRGPFQGTTLWDVMAQKRSGAPPLGTHVSRPTAEFVASLMAFRPEDRPGSYEELIARLDELPALSGRVTVPILGPRPVQTPDNPLTTAITLDPAQPVTRPLSPGRARRWKVPVGLLLLLGAAIAAWSFLRPDPEVPPRVEYQSTGRHEALFDGRSLLGWTPVGGRPWTLEKDDEGQTVLSGQGAVVRRFRMYPDYRILIGLDLFQATSVELLLAEDDSCQWVIRLTRQDGAVVGKRVGSGFEPLGPAVPFPTSHELEGVRPYLELRYDRTASGLEAFFRGKSVAVLPPEAPPTPAEVRLTIVGGPAHIESAMVDELVPRP